MPNKARKSFRKHPMELLDDEAQVESCLGPFGDSVSISARQAQKSFWTNPMVLLGDEAQVEYLISFHLDIVLILTQDRCAVCAECTIGLEIILDAPDGTPR